MTETKGRRGWNKNMAMGLHGSAQTGLLVTTRCPVTHGAATRLTQDSFQRLCSHRRDYGALLCRRCEGRTPPPELEIITDAEMRTINYEENDMSMYGECEICGEKKKIRRVRNKNACPTCEHIWRAVNVVPDVVLKAIAETKGDDYLRQAVRQTVGVEVSQPPPILYESEQDSDPKLLEQILEKYGLESISSIPDFVDNCNRAAEILGDVQKMLGINGAASIFDTINSLNIQCNEYHRRAHAAETVIKDVRALLALEQDESIIESVAELRRKYNFAKSELHDSEGVVELIAEKVGRGPGKTVIDAVEGLLRARQQAMDIMYEVASEVGLGLGDITDLPRIVADIVAEWRRPDNIIDPVIVDAGNRTTALLDLALDVIAGRVSGLDAERIAALR